MPYKDLEQAKAAKHASYLRNKDKVIARSTQGKRELKVWLNRLKSTMECEKCGENHPSVLDFHHRDPTTKDGSVTRILANTMSREKILKEIEKCDVLCANCHRKLHWEMQNKIMDW